MIRLLDSTIRENPDLAFSGCLVTVLRYAFIDETLKMDLMVYEGNRYVHFTAGSLRPLVIIINNNICKLTKKYQRSPLLGVKYENCKKTIR